MFPSLVLIQEETDSEKQIGFLFAVYGMFKVHGWFIFNSYSFCYLRCGWSSSRFMYWTENGSDGRY